MVASLLTYRTGGPWGLLWSLYGPCECRSVRLPIHGPPACSFVFLIVRVAKCVAENTPSHNTANVEVKARLVLAYRPASSCLR